MILTKYKMTDSKNTTAENSVAENKDKDEDESLLDIMGNFLGIKVRMNRRVV